MIANYVLNNDLHGVEIYFDEKPGEVVRNALKAARFRWNGKKSCWYARQTETALQLAEKLTKGRAAAGEVVKAEGAIKEAAAKMTVERMNAIKAGYTFRETGEGIYSGWAGCNEKLSLYGQGLKKAILSELKKNGIVATARSGRGGYTDSFTFTITVPEECQVSQEEYVAEEMLHWGPRCWYLKPEGGDIHRDVLASLPDDKCNAIRKYTIETEYKNSVRDGGTAFVKSEFVDLVKTIVSSFNHDNSDSMTDYFDHGFYDWYRWKRG